jgi:hypothetical protein
MCVDKPRVVELKSMKDRSCHSGVVCPSIDSNLPTDSILDPRFHHPNPYKCPSRDLIRYGARPEREGAGGGSPLPRPITPISFRVIDR